jgi:hypothetical protein
MESGPAPLLIQAYVADLVIYGVTRQTSERTRLVDVLNTGDGTFTVESARVQAGGAAQSYSRVILEKHRLIAIIPIETEAQLRRQAEYRLGMSRQPTMRLQVSVFSPPYHLAGTVHLTSAQPIERVLPALNRFFVMTNATLTSSDGATSEHTVIVVNRDNVNVLGQP